MHRTHRGSETGVGWSPQHNRGNVCHGSFSPGSGLYDLDVVCILEPLPKWSHAGVVRGFVAMAQRAKPNVTGTGDGRVESAHFSFCFALLHSLLFNDTVDVLVTRIGKGNVAPYLDRL